MSNSNLEMKWFKFGKDLRNIGGLLILVIIPYIAFVALFIQFFLIIGFLSNLNDINREQKNPFLNDFRSRYLTASIIKLIGGILIHSAGALIVYFRYMARYVPDQPFFPVPPIFRFSALLALLIIGFILMITGSSIEIGAWNNLKSYINLNREMLPKNGNKAIEGVERIRSGAVLWVLGFLFIPIIIGWIFQISGYFTLANQELFISKESIETIEPQDINGFTQADNPPSTSTLTLAEVGEDLIKFCPLCGSKLSYGGQYCGECGYQVKD